MLWKIFLWGFFLYIFYRFVFGFILPIYKTTRHIKKSFKDMQEKAGNAQTHTQQENKQDPLRSNNTSVKQTPIGEYIDFEEVK